MTWWQRLFYGSGAVEEGPYNTPPKGAILPKGYIKGKVLALQPHPVLDRLKKEGYFFNEEYNDGEGRWQRTWTVGTPKGVEYAFEIYMCRWNTDRFQRPEWRCFDVNQ